MQAARCGDTIRDDINHRLLRPDSVRAAEADEEERVKTNRILAEKISNDVAEDIDCGESREKLRMAVYYWSSVAAKEASERARLQMMLKLVKIAVQ